MTLRLIELHVLKDGGTRPRSTPDASSISAARGPSLPELRVLEAPQRTVATELSFNVRSHMDVTLLERRQNDSSSPGSYGSQHQILAVKDDR